MKGLFSVFGGCLFLALTGFGQIRVFDNGQEIPGSESSGSQTEEVSIEASAEPDLGRTPEETPTATELQNHSPDEGIAQDAGSRDLSISSEPQHDDVVSIETHLKALEDTQYVDDGRPPVSRDLSYFVAAESWPLDRVEVVDARDLRKFALSDGGRLYSPLGVWVTDKRDHIFVSRSRDRNRVPEDIEPYHLWIKVGGSIFNPEEVQFDHWVPKKQKDEFLQQGKSTYSGAKVEWVYPMPVGTIDATTETTIVESWGLAPADPKWRLTKRENANIVQALVHDPAYGKWRTELRSSLEALPPKRSAHYQTISPRLNSFETPRVKLTGKAKKVAALEGATLYQISPDGLLLIFGKTGSEEPLQSVDSFLVSSTRSFVPELFFAVSE